MTREDKSDMFISEIKEHVLSKIFSTQAEINEFFDNVKKPEMIFTLRVNTIKISRDSLIELIRKNNPEVEITEGPFYNTIIMNITGPFEVHSHSKRIMIDRYAAEAVMVGADLFFPGVKFPEGKVKKGDMVSLVSLDTKTIVAEAISQEDAINIRADIRGICAVNVNSLYKTPKFRNFKPDLWDAGYYTDQSLIPLFAIHSVLEYYKEGMKIFDLCAAPGNKTSAISEILYTKYNIFPSIVAIDRSKNRLNSLEDYITRLNLSNITVVNDDIKNYMKSNRSEVFETGDIVIFDPSCSALGKRPKLNFDFGYKQIQQSAGYQMELAAYAVEYLKPGGIFMYNTCTLAIDENEMICKELIENYSLTPLFVEIPDYFSQKYKVGRGIPIEGLEDHCKNFVRFYVGKELGESYFIAILKKKPNN